MSKYHPFDPANAELEQEDVFNFLVALRDSGITNMWGATPYIEEMFDCSRAEAKYWHLAWIKSFDEVKEEVVKDEYIVP